jgi:hypothetical protein
MVHVGRGLDECPMVLVQKGNGMKVGTKQMEYVQTPSKGDANFVRKYYP